MCLQDLELQYQLPNANPSFTTLPNPGPLTAKPRLG